MAARPIGAGTQPSDQLVALAVGRNLKPVQPHADLRVGSSPIDTMLGLRS
jgi:hypothetical protein